MSSVTDITRKCRSRLTPRARRGPKVVEATVKAAFLAVLLSVSILLPSAAQQTAPASPQPLQLLRGTLGALSANTLPRDVTLSGTAHYIAGSDDQTGTATLKATATGASRIDLNLSSGPRTEISNSASGAPVGKWSGPDGIPHDIAFHNLVTEPSWFFPTFLLLRAVAPSGYVTTYIGHETLNGQAVEHLTIAQTSNVQTPLGVTTLTHLTQTDVFIDCATLLPAAIAFNVHPDDNMLIDIPIEIRFSDYRPVNGAQIPFHIQKFLRNGLALDIQIQSAAINSGLALNEFNIQ